jgi:hypothetical protein
VRITALTAGIAAAAPIAEAARTLIQLDLASADAGAPLATLVSAADPRSPREISVRRRVSDGLR